MVSFASQVPIRIYVGLFRMSIVTMIEFSVFVLVTERILIKSNKQSMQTIHPLLFKDDYIIDTIKIN